MLAFSNTLVFVLACLLHSPTPGLSSGGAWCYGDDPDCGEHTWPGMCKDGQRQSPIDLPAKDSIPKTDDGLEILKESYVFKGFTLKHTGTGIKIFPKDVREDRMVRSSPHKAVYMFKGVRLHYGSDSSKGSEHLFEGKAFAGDIQLHYYQNNYSSLDEAFKDFKTPDAFAGMVVQLNEVPESPLLESIVEHLPKVKEPGQETTVEADLDLTALFKAEWAYTYSGSDAAPKCAENQGYMILAEPVDISKKVMEALRTIIMNKKGKPMVVNGRKAGPIKGHKLQYAKVVYKKP